MYGNDALGVPPRAEGVPLSGVYYNRASSVVPPVEGGFAAAPGGAAIGRFGWAGLDGLVRNERLSPGDALGLVAIQDGDWRAVYWDDVTRTWRIRQGLPVTMLSGAPGVLVKISDSCFPPWNERIYTSPLDGRIVAGYVAGLELTPWLVGTPSVAGGLTLITTWNN